MATRTVTQSSANAAKSKSFLWAVAGIVNSLVTFANEMITDHGTFKTVVDDCKTALNLDTTCIGDLKTLANALRTYLADGLLQIATIVVSPGTATDFKFSTASIYTIAGLPYTKAITDTLPFTTADTINLAGAATTAHWGAWQVRINAAGAVSTVHATYTSGTDQDYSTEALAIAALPAITSGYVQVGYITVQGLASTAWTATTSNFTVGGGAGNCTARNFYDLPGAKTLAAVVSSSPGSAVSSSSPATLSAAACDSVSTYESGAPA